MTKTVDETTVPPRMSRIERLMADLEKGAEGHPTDRGEAQVMRDARELILALFGMAELPPGESVYQEWLKRAKAEHGGAGDTEDDLRNAHLFSKQWIAEIWPVDPQGKIPFERALIESLSDTVSAYLKRLDAERKAAQS